MTLTDSATKPMPRTGAGPARRERAGGPPAGATPRRRVWWPSTWRRPSRSGWILAAIATATAVLYSWSLSSVGYGNWYYAAAVKSASTSWKALFFGSIDPGQLHHRRQATRRVLAPGALGSGLRLQLVEHAAARGARGRRVRPDPAPPGPQVGRRLGRPPRRGGVRPHPGRGRDVPLQQPRRAAHVVVSRRRVGALVGGGDRTNPHAGALRGPRRVGVRHQDAAGLPGAARVHPRLPRRGEAQARPAALAADAGPRSRSSCRRAGGWPSSRSGRRRAGRTSAARRTTASSA